MSSILRRRHRAVLAGQPVQIQALDAVRLSLLAALPLAVLAGSPQRVVLSAAIAAAYVAAAAFTFRRSRSNLAVVGYAAVAAGWMTVSWLRTRYLLHLDSAQLSYATSKTMYFVAIVLPMSAAVTMMVDRAADFRPTATSQVVIGGAVALITIAFMGDHFLGADRYAWQGNLIALGTAIAIQPWPIQNIKVSAVIGALGVVGIMMAGSRQSLAAIVVAMLLSAAYWAAASIFSERGSLYARMRKSPAGRYAALSLILLLLTGAYVAVTYVADRGVQVASGQASAPTYACQCVTDRIISLQMSAGDRDQLIAHGVQLFLHNPVLGAGLGSFAGAIPNSLAPGESYQYPHNVPLEIAAEMGLVGLAIMMAPLLAGWSALLWTGMKRMSAPVAAVLMVVAVFFTVANVSGDIPSDRGLWIFGIVALKLGIDAWPKRAAETRSFARAV